MSKTVYHAIEYRPEYVLGIAHLLDRHPERLVAAAQQMKIEDIQDPIYIVITTYDDVLLQYEWMFKSSFDSSYVFLGNPIPGQLNRVFKKNPRFMLRDYRG